MTVNGRFCVNAGSYIRVCENSQLILNGGFMNEGVQIICGASIVIGRDCDYSFSYICIFIYGIY